ncbi:hypothetical protein [Fibrisoma limi]|uniref:hypothetical protein n=1 Tax=Fibrisoma limi TaxID=663275 RepID=UPI000586CDBE|nr:hypothetical protein [Fibrisoma limi]
MKQYNEARRWVSLLYDLDRLHLGEEEMWLGKIAYEEGNLNIATKWFQVAFQKSEGRLFLGRDSEKYYKFYLQSLK